MEARTLTLALPVELQHAIIDELRSDTFGLALCSLVCKHWRLQSHRHKFSTLTFTHLSFLPFYQLTRDEFSYSAIVPSVKAVKIRGPLTSLSDWERERLSDLIFLLTAQGDVTTFSLHKLKWTALEPDAPPLKLPRRWPTVSTLELIGTHFSSKRELASFLEIFSNLRCLVLQDSNCVVPNDPIPVVIPPGSYSLALRCLADFSMQRRLQWDVDTENAHISAADLADLMILFSTQKTMSDLVQTLADFLNGLHLITQTIQTYRDASLGNLNLSSVTSLRKLSLGSSKRVLSLLTWIPYVLDQLPDREPPTLIALQIAFASSRQFYLDRSFLVYIAKILSKPQFRRLRTIQFAVFSNIKGQGLEQTIRETITDVFPDWFRRGILMFTFLQLG